MQRTAAVTRKLESFPKCCFSGYVAAIPLAEVGSEQIDPLLGPAVGKVNQE